jgi:hypothetical protein
MIQMKHSLVQLYHDPQCIHFTQNEAIQVLSGSDTHHAKSLCSEKFKHGSNSGLLIAVFRSQE